MMQLWPPVGSDEAMLYFDLIVSDLVIVTQPNGPLSRALIAPPAAVLEIAPANVLHGAVRLHGLTSSPTPETHVRVAWAEAEAGMIAAATRAAAMKRRVADRRERCEVPSVGEKVMRRPYSRPEPKATPIRQLGGSPPWDPVAPCSGPVGISHTMERCGVGWQG